MRHGSFWLISGHVSEDGGADGAFGPLFISDEFQKTGFMIFMWAS